MSGRPAKPGGKLSNVQLRALTALRDHGPLAPKAVAHKLWPPDHPGWRKVHRCGYGSAVGTGMPQAAGAVLGRLYKLGLIHTNFGDGGSNKHSITDKGRAELERAQKARA